MPNFFGIKIGFLSPEIARSADWRRQNIVEVVQLAVFAARFDSDPFTYEQLRRNARRFYCGRLTDGQIIGALLTRPMVEADVLSGLLAQEGTPMRLPNCPPEEPSE